MRRAEVGGRASAAAVGALLVFAVFFGHGTSGGRLFWIGAAALVVVAVGWAVRPPALSAAGAVFFALLGLFVVWQAISIRWSIQPAGSWDYANRGLVYLAFAFAGALVAGIPRARIGEAVALLLGVLFFVALLGKVAAGIYPDYGRLARLRWPLQYWNELALLAAACVPIALWLSARRRVLGSLLAYAAFVTVVLTFSRFGIALAVVAAIVWIVLDRERLEALPALIVAVIPAAIVAGIALALPGVANDGVSHSARVRDGLIFGALVIVGGVLLAFGSRWDPAVSARRRYALQAAIVVALVVVGAVVALIVHAGGPVSFAQQRWHEFSRAQGTQSVARFGSASSGNRWMWWQQAWRAFVHHPGGGTGAGTFALTSTLDSHNSLQTTIEPHNTPLQFLSETGIVGFLLYVGMVAAVVVAALRARRDSAVLALSIFLAVAVVHAVVDIDWDFVATQGLVFALAGALVARAAVPRFRVLPAVATAVCCLAAFYSLFAPWWSNRSLDAAYSAKTFGSALADAKQAHSLNPLALDPLYALAAFERDPMWMRKAVKREPRNPETWYELAVFEYKLGNIHAAYDAATHSYHLDNYGPAGQPGNVGILAACKLHLRTKGCSP